MAYLKIIHPHAPPVLCCNWAGQRQRQCWAVSENKHTQTDNAVAWLAPRPWTLTRSSQKLAPERRWPHTVHTVQLTRQHTSRRPAHPNYLQTICSDNRVSIVHHSYQKWEASTSSWLNTSECNRNKHNAATGIISGPVDTGQCLFLC